MDTIYGCRQNFSSLSLFFFLVFRVCVCACLCDFIFLMNVCVTLLLLGIGIFEIQDLISIWSFQETSFLWIILFTFVSLMYTRQRNFTKKKKKSKLYQNHNLILLNTLANMLFPILILF